MVNNYIVNFYIFNRKCVLIGYTKIRETIKCIVIIKWFQSTVNGVIGLRGQHAPSHAEADDSQEHVPVTTPPQNMAALPVQDLYPHYKVAIHITAQVSSNNLFISIL